MFLKILSKMYRRLHCRGPDYSPDHHDDVDIKHIVFWLTTKFLSYVLSSFSQYGQHRSGISSCCGGTFLYQCGSLSFLPQVSLHWRSNLHQIVSLENSKLCFHSNHVSLYF